MNIKVIYFLLSFFPVLSYASECTLNPQQVSAEYEVKKHNIKNNQMALDTYTLFLWRDNGRTAQEYQNTRITQFWEKTKQNKLRHVRYFDKEKRAIEYVPEDMKIGDTSRQWELMNQLIPNNMIAAMTKESESGAGCDRQESYTVKKGEAQLELTWLPELMLVKSMTDTRPGYIKQWTLKAKITDMSVSKNAFEMRESYYATDYADIGDNESDPFLMNMINLGHINGGASGFYDKHGNDIGGGHNHGHGHNH